jgi:hypothetical protein
MSLFPGSQPLARSEYLAVNQDSAPTVFLFRS